MKPIIQGLLLGQDQAKFLKGAQTIKEMTEFQAALFASSYLKWLRGSSLKSSSAGCALVWGWGQGIKKWDGNMSLKEFRSPFKLRN